MFDRHQRVTDAMPEMGLAIDLGRFKAPRAGVDPVILKHPADPLLSRIEEGRARLLALVRAGHPRALGRRGVR
jgi:hypothetical protein